MFILLDTDEAELVPYYDHVNDLDDKPVLSFEDSKSYLPDGGFHIVDTLPSGMSRWEHLRLATLGARVYSDSFDKESPLHAGPLPVLDKVRKISVDGAIADTRAGLFASFGVNYIGRTKLNPRNIFVLDNKKGNPLHDPSLDPTLEALYGCLPGDWWGSCGFVSTGNIDKLEAFFEAFPDVIPLAFTSGAFSKLKYLGLEYVPMSVPNGTEKYGITVRENSNRLSYKLSLPDVPEEPAQQAEWKI